MVGIRKNLKVVLTKGDGINDIMHKWFLELINKLYRAFYDHEY